MALARDHSYVFALSRFKADQSGIAAILFGFSVLALGLAVGAALDYTRASSVRTSLTSAADAAALSAVSLASMSQSTGKAKNAALDLFNARVTALKLPATVKVKAEVHDKDGQRTATVSFEADVPTTLMRLVGRDTVTVAEQSVANSALPQYIDFHLLLDNTPSMGVAATPADIAKMVANTPDQCAFACHDLSNAGKDYYAKAKSLGVTMRIDVVRQATQKLMDTAVATAVVPGQFRAAVHTFGTTCTGLGVTTVAGLTSNLSSVRADSSAIDLMTIPHQNYNNDQCTDFDETFVAMDKLIAHAGDGSGASKAQKVLFFVSDGVADAAYPVTCSKPTTGGRCQEPIKVADCKALKDRGVQIAVLYTTYLPLPTNGWYNTWIKPFETEIGPRMEACASPGLYFEVSPSQGIAEAMEALFKKVVFRARIAS